MNDESKTDASFSVGFLVCGCGRWMHTQGIAEQPGLGDDHWLVRSECCGCRWRVGLEVGAADAHPFIDRLMWTDEARHLLDRMPPYVQVLLRPSVDDYARAKGARVVTMGLLGEARRGGSVRWDAEADARLSRVPASVRAMAKAELEKTALERGHEAVTVALMEELKARYFGMAGKP
ncbi:MAG: PCP reductase family protein [Nitrospirae bacterium]|nr:PCP reductase family protein [Nitrospirota bacterium]